MPALVVDFSVAAAWCFPDERTDYTNGILRALDGSISALAPKLWNYEIRNSVLMGVRRKRISDQHARQFLGSINNLPIQLTDPVSSNAVYELANDTGLTVYDASYLDLAMREKLPLATLDRALLDAAAKASVILFKP